MTPPDKLLAYQAAGAISREDIAAAAMLVEMASRSGAANPSLLVWLGTCLALRTVRDGHTCVDLDRIADWAGDIDTKKPEGLEWPTDAGSWLTALEACTTLVGTLAEQKLTGTRKPLILDGHRLYLARSLAEEQAIADALRGRARTGRIHILLGGPGTGKTTKVAKDLVERFGKLSPGEALPQIALAAPTGKAAARMTEAVKQACKAAGGSEALLQWIGNAPARTIHKLLGFNPSRTERFAYHAKETLPYRLVIIDEASMISSTLMHHLLSAVDPEAELRLVGDPNQLASVDAGTVLGDIAISGDADSQDHPLHGCIETLEKIYRQESANILGLGKAVRTGNTADALALLAAGSPDIEWIDPADATKLNAITKMAVAHAKKLQDVANGSDPGNVLTTQSEFQVLCGHRAGEMGVSGWNARIEKGLGIRATDPWYVGRPVMVTRNTTSLGLSNGDVGAIVTAGDRREALFGLPSQSLRVPVARLEDIDTVHAFTIHKSQGSEYDHVVVVLPDRPSRIVTRELLYTGITRARTKVTVVGLRDVITAAIKTPIRRATGLAARLA